MEHPVDRRPGNRVTIRQMPAAIFSGAILGVLAGVALAGLVVGIGVPLGPPLDKAWNLVFALVWLVGGAAIGTLSWWGRRLRFEPDELVITRPTGRRRHIRWEHVESVGIATAKNEDGDLVQRWLTVTVLRHPETPVPPTPTVLGEFRAWRKQHFRTVRLGVAMPVKATDAHSKFTFMALKVRTEVLRELELRGFQLPAVTESR
jgi:hypothetical protein